jgi:sensor histidine kinase YesM
MLKKNIKFFIKVVQNRIVHHILFWILSFYVLLNLFSNSSEITKIDYLYTAIFQLTLMIAVYINLLFFIPRFLSRKKILFFILFSILALFICSFFNVLLFNKLIDYVLPGYYFISYYSFLDILKFFLVFILLTTLLKLSREWFQLIETKQELIEIEKEKVEIELKALRAQVNPHFLFNSLNVLYSLALKNAKETPETIIKLSDILRYVIYDSNKEKVSIKSEVELINNYLSLQEYRIDKSSNIRFTPDIQTNIDIAPMFFLPLVENSFKHGVKGDVSNTFVHINLKTRDKTVHFEIENNIGSSENPDQNKDGGIGLANIKRRLRLLYPEKHELLIKHDEQKFMVSLKIKL